MIISLQFNSLLENSGSRHLCRCYFDTYHHLYIITDQVRVRIKTLHEKSKLQTRTHARTHACTQKEQVTNMKITLKRKVLVRRPVDCMPPNAVSLPTVTGPAGWHWWDLTDWSTDEK